MYMYMYIKYNIRRPILVSLPLVTIYFVFFNVFVDIYVLGGV
jgi:hypothetical protein